MVVYKTHHYIEYISDNHTPEGIIYATKYVISIQDKSLYWILIRRII